MYAIFEDGGRQYKASPGDKVYVDLRDLAEGQDTLEFDHVLAVGQGEDARIGQPLIEGAKVVAKIEGEVKGPKIDVIKFRRRKTYQRKQGHRQKHIRVTISEIIS